MLDRWRKTKSFRKRLKYGERKALMEDLSRLRDLEQRWEDASEFGTSRENEDAQRRFANAASAFVRRWHRELPKN